MTRWIASIVLVASGQRDLGIVHRWGGVALAMPDHLVETPLFTDVADVILRRDHPLALSGASSLTPACESSMPIAALRARRPRNPRESVTGTHLERSGSAWIRGTLQAYEAGSVRLMRCLGR